MFQKQGENEMSQVSINQNFEMKIKIVSNLRLMHLPPAPPKEIAGIITECAVH